MSRLPLDSVVTLLALAGVAFPGPQLVVDHEAELVASDAAAADLGGAAVDIDGDTAIVGAYEDGTARGAAYVWSRSGTVWTEDQKLVAPDGADFDYFGTRVALDGEWAVVSAPGDDDVGSFSGSVYVYRLIGTTWTYTQKLTASDGQAGDTFGEGAAISHPWIVVGAQSDDDVGANGGSAYFFQFQVNTFVEVQKVYASDGGAQNAFGFTVAIDGDTAAIGGYAHSHNATTDGAVYVFELSGGTWSETQELLATPSLAGQQLGLALDLEGDRLLAGAPNEDASKGAVYVFHRTGSVWSQEGRLRGHGPALNDQFGYAVGLADPFAVVGAPFENGAGTASGLAYVFQRTGARWVQRNAWVPPDIGTDDQLGRAAAMSGDTALVGEPKDDDAGTSSGSVQVLVVTTTDPGPYCFGDDTVCPCGNGGAVNTGCENAQATGGVKLDTAIFAPDGNGGGAVTFMGQGFPTGGSPTALVIRNTTAEITPPVFGDGIRCISAAGVVRFGATGAVEGVSLHPHSHGAGAGTFYYQLWYRNNPATFCTPDAFNLSNGYEITW